VTLRRQFTLLDDDEKFLQDYGLPWEAVVDGSQWVLIHDFPLPDGYNNASVTASIRLETGYPNTELNMVYFYPAISRKDGKPIGATQSTQQIDGKVFQRWSRHRTPQNPWKAGRDNLSTHIILIEDWLEREFKK
jgi:Prokaryotic E2 family E